MKTIEAKVTITHVDGWDVDWSNDVVKSNQLEQLSSEIRDVIARGCGINFSNISVESKIKN
jgi:hypothetical protein